MRRTLTLDDEDVGGLAKLGLNSLLIELDENGDVIKELGFGPDGYVAHRFPGGPSVVKPKKPDYPYGLFDLVPFGSDTQGNLDSDEFDRLWAQE